MWTNDVCVFVRHCVSVDHTNHGEAKIFNSCRKLRPVEKKKWKLNIICTKPFTFHIVCIYDRVALNVFLVVSFETAAIRLTCVAHQALVICASPRLNSCSLPLPPLQPNAEELRAERLRRATERLRSPVVFNKDAAVRKTQLKSFSQYVESRPGKESALRHHRSTPARLINTWVKSSIKLC